MTAALESNITNGKLNIMGFSVSMEDILTDIYDVLTDLISNLSKLINVGLALLVITKGKAIGQVAMNSVFNAGATLSGWGNSVRGFVGNLKNVP